MNAKSPVVAHRQFSQLYAEKLYIVDDFVYVPIHVVIMSRKNFINLLINYS